MGRSPCCTKVGLRRGPWSTEEDTILTNYIQEHGEGQWKSLPKNAGLLRCGKSCRLRWMNYLRPDIKRGNISQDEEDLIVRLHGLLGNRWSLIAGRLPGRTDNEIKNYWNTYLVKKLKNTGISPKSHKPPKANKKKKIEKQKKVITTTTTRTTKKKMSDLITSDEEQVLSTNNDPPKTKVYMPKAIRVSSEFSRTSSNDSLSTSTIEWPPLCELEDGFLGFGPTLSPPLHHQHYMDLLSGDDVNMWDNVYDEYFQLL